MDGGDGQTPQQQQQAPTVAAPQRLTVPFQLVGETSGRQYLLDQVVKCGEEGLVVSMKNAYPRCLLKGMAIWEVGGVAMASSRVVRLMPGTHGPVCKLGSEVHGNVRVIILVTVIPMEGGQGVPKPTYKIIMPLDIQREAPAGITNN